MNDIETLKQKIIDDLSDIRDKDILEYIAKRMGCMQMLPVLANPFSSTPKADVMPMTRQSLRLKRA